MATKVTKQKKGKTLRLPPFSDSPITVGGGGGIGPWVELHFLHDDYVPDPDDPLNFINKQSTLRDVVINGGEPEDLPAKSEITIVFKKGGQFRKISITADPPSDPLGVRFKGNHLKYNHQSKKHRDDGAQLKKVIINGVATNFQDEGEIIIHTK